MSSPHHHPAHQCVVLLQGDQGIKDVHIDRAEVESVGLVLLLPILATDLEERQVHGGVARFRQDVSAGAPDSMVTAIEAYVLGPVLDSAHSHPWRTERWLRSGPASSRNRPSPHLQGKEVEEREPQKGRGQRKESRPKDVEQVPLGPGETYISSSRLPWEP